jgi:beta-mannanase
VYPFFIRFGAEFNIHQDVEFWSGAYSWSKDPADFVKAWRRYVDIFRSEQVSNAIFIWNANWNDAGPHHWTEYYPGDNYVDWVGIDLYQYDPHSQPEQMIKGIYDDYCNKKPIAIVEWGANWEGQNYTDSERAEFINKFFDAVEARPQIKMINYWYCGDFRFDPKSFPLTTAAYVNRISNPRYID